MEKFIFFRHRHRKEWEALTNSYKNNIKIPEYILKKLRETQEFDWTDKNIKKSQETMYDKFVCLPVNYIDAYMVEENKAIAYQTFVYFNKQADIFMIETKPEYRRKGIANELLNDVEKILFKKLEVNSISSTATNYSKGLFKKHAYVLKKYNTPKFIAGDLNPSNVEVQLTKELYSNREKIK